MYFAQAHCRTTSRLGFTLIEVLIAFGIFAIATSGLIYGYVHANRTATWSSWSLAAQSIASQGLERARAAQWNELQPSPYTNGAGTADEWPPYTNASGVVLAKQDTNCTLDVPSSGSLIYVTNYIYVGNIGSGTPPMRMIRSDCVWNFPLTGQLCTNTVISLRAPDQ
jgi:prepilin-type N-terminal cleavage/methylation domain-containing protein